MARRTADVWVVSIATLLLTLTAIVVWGWVRIPGEPWRTFPDPALRADTGLEVRVMLRRDTISSRDRSPVEVVYYIVNGPSEARFINDPERFFIGVLDARGQLVQPAFWSHRPTGMWGIEMRLPAGAVFGQIENLRCVRYSGYGPATGTRVPDCLAMWDFARPGTYRVVVKYNGPDDYGNFDSLTALSDSGKIDFPIEPRAIGRRLADTATLVVQ